MAIENFKFFSGVFPTIMTNVFQLNTNFPYNLRSRNELYCRNPKIGKYGAETISYLASKIWYLDLKIITSRKSLNDFESKIRQ